MTVRSIASVPLFVISGIIAVAPAAAKTEEPGETKLRLLSEALTARDLGDVATARARLEELLRHAPNDATVTRLLAGLAQPAKKEISVSGGTIPASADDSEEIERLMRQEESRRGATNERVAPAGTPVQAAATDQPAGNSPPDVPSLLSRGRAQLLAGEFVAAAQSFARVLEREPGNAEARRRLENIARAGVDRNAARPQTSAQLLNEVERAWQRPEPAPPNPPGPAGPAPVGLAAKLESIVLPAVNFSGVELGRVVSALSRLADEFDAGDADARGVNIVLVDPAGANPTVRLTLKNVPLKRALDLVTESVGYRYEVQPDTVIVRPGIDPSVLETKFFPVSRSTVLRLTGRAAAELGRKGDPAAGGAQTSAPLPAADEGRAIRGFLQLAGVNFEDTPGSTLAFDGSQLIVTHTPRNLVRVDNILARYRDVRQVEIEAKFMEVQDGALEELGVNWRAATKAALTDPRVQSSYILGNRSLADAFKNATTSQQIQITGQEPIAVNPPALPGTVNLGASAPPLASLSGIFGEFNVQAIIRALAQRSGTELLSAPKLTVLSGNQATITVAQELRYPQSYGQVQSQVGTGSASGGGSAGVSITAGTPQEFTTRNIGVELKVTPTVEEDERSISLELNPKVTEFEGFVEYGGPSVAISQGTTVTVPPGFYQPIFAVREVNTRVTIWDGATLVMGGLTREDTRKTNDKVPLIGNLPVLGRLFRSSGQSAQKRNLLIFVTANLVNPGGALKKEGVSGIYQNPTVVTPAGPAGRRTEGR
ncbi:MAG: type II secretory pathway, component PulD [Opitutus sp.]|nr:type II secretory pathway, component PulD [Opitutus sp.]